MDQIFTENKIHDSSQLLGPKKNLLKQAIQKQKEKKYQEAISNYIECLKEDKNNEFILANLALIYQKLDDKGKAITTYNKLLEINPNESTYYINLVNIKISLQDLENAKILLETGLRKIKNNIILLTQHAIICLNLGQLEEAYRSINIASENDTIKIITFFYKGLIELKSNQNLLSRKSFEICINNCKEQAKLCDFSFKLRNIGSLSEAIIFMKAAIKRSPNSNIYKSNLIGLYREAGSYKEAIKIAEELIKSKPKEINPYLNYSSCLVDIGQIKKATEICKIGLTLDPNSAIGHLTLGAIMKNSGDYKAGIYHTEKALEIDPNIPNGLLNLSGLLQDNNEIEKASEIMNILIEKDQKNPALYLNLANLYQVKGDIKKTEDTLLKCIELSKENYRAHFLLSLGKNYLKNAKLVRNILSENGEEIMPISNRIDFFFTKANIQHFEKDYKNASQSLTKANQLKLSLYPSDKDKIILDANLLSKDYLNSEKDLEPSYDSEIQKIFITGMPRCGSTLIESIISTNDNIKALGEVDHIQNLYNQSKIQTINKQDITKIYQDLTNSQSFKATVDKQLYNYIFTGFILEFISSPKVIFCIRNPLDNILSIYKSHFLSGNRYSSSLSDCAELYLYHYNLLKKYHEKFGEHIYKITYEKLVTDPNNEIKKLIDWLNFKWDEKYLSPNRNNRIVTTASRIQVRSPINSKSIGGWKKYEDLLLPIYTFFKDNNKEIFNLITDYTP